MNKAQVNRALKDEVEVAVYAIDYEGRIAADPLRYASDRERVIRCRVVATGQRRVERLRWSSTSDHRPYRLSNAADGIRVTPLDPLPTGPGFGVVGIVFGAKPAHPEFDGTEAHAFEDTEDRLVTSRHIVGIWAEWADRVNARVAHEAAEQARHEAALTARAAGLEAAAHVAAKLEGFGLPVSVEVGRPGAVVVSVKVAEQIAAIIAAGCDLTNATQQGGEALSEAVVKFGLALAGPDDESEAA